MKLLSYQPDADPVSDGIVTECQSVIPTYRGLAGAPSPQDGLSDALEAAVVGAFSGVKLDMTTRVFSATADKLWELSSGSWSNVSGGSYTAANYRWRFAQYGDVTLAVSKENQLTASTTGNFADVYKMTGEETQVDAPGADIVEVVNDFVFLANTINGPSPYDSDNPHRWWCSAIGDYTNWTPDVATQCATGLLTSVPGKITAARKFGDQIIMYKKKGMYVGTYVGPPIIWQFPEIPTANTGTWSQESVVNIGTPEQPLHFFVGPDDFYLFDGSRPLAIGHGVKERFFNELNIENGDQICIMQHRSKNLVYIYYPTSGATLDHCLVFNYRMKRWGRDDRTVEYAFEYITPGVTYDDLGSLYATYEDGPSAAYDVAFAGKDTVLPGLFDDSHKLYTMTGGSSTSSLTTGDLGDDLTITNVSRVTPRFIRKPTGVTLSNYYRASSGETLTADQTISVSQGRFDFMRSACWHRFVMNFTGDWELNEAKVDAHQDGLE